jgi:hypothetical protein
VPGSRSLEPRPLREGDRVCARCVQCREIKRAAIERRAAGIAVCIRKRQRAGANLGEAAAAADKASQCRVVSVGIKCATASIQADRTASGKARQILKCAAG